MDDINAILSAATVLGLTLIGIGGKWYRAIKDEEKLSKAESISKAPEGQQEGLTAIADKMTPHLLEAMVAFVTRLTTLEVKIAELEERTVAQTKEIARLQTELEHKIAQLDELQAAYDTAKADNAALIKQIEMLRGEIEILRGEIARLRGN